MVVSSDYDYVWKKNFIYLWKWKINSDQATNRLLKFFIVVCTEKHVALYHLWTQRNVSVSAGSLKSTYLHNHEPVLWLRNGSSYRGVTRVWQSHGTLTRLLLLRYVMSRKTGVSKNQMFRVLDMAVEAYFTMRWEYDEWSCSTHISNPEFLKSWICLCYVVALNIPDPGLFSRGKRRGFGLFRMWKTRNSLEALNKEGNKYYRL